MQYVLIYHFECSAMAEDALDARRMNVHPGGKQAVMRPGWYRRGPLKFKQSMVFEDGPNKGLAKGLRAVCQERFGEGVVLGKYKKSGLA